MRYAIRDFLRPAVCSAFFRCLGIAFFLYFALTISPFVGPQAQAAQAVRLTDVHTAGVSAMAFPLVPHMEYLLDPDGGMSIENASSSAVSPHYKPFSHGIPGDFSGPVWLRFTLEKKPGAAAQEYRLNLGSGMQGETRLFTPREAALGQNTEAFSLQSAVTDQVSFTLSPPPYNLTTMYIHLSAAPAVWFNPSIATASLPAESLPLPLLAPLLLAAAIAMCLLRAVAEKAQWRGWAAFLASLGLFQFFFPPYASSAHLLQRLQSSGFVSADMLPSLTTPVAVAVMLAPGMTLMLMPHVGRHLLKTPSYAPKTDVYLQLYSVVGAIVALLPFIPGYAWTSRYLVFWPLLAAPLLPVAIRAMSRQVAGAPAFLTLCLMPVIGAGISLYEITVTEPAFLGASGPLSGLAIGVAALALTPAIHPEENRKRSQESKEGTAGKSGPHADPKNTLQEAVFAHLANSPAPGTAEDLVITPLAMHKGLELSLEMPAMTREPQPASALAPLGWGLKQYTEPAPRPEAAPSPPSSTEPQQSAEHAEEPLDLGPPLSAPAAEALHETALQSEQPETAPQPLVMAPSASPAALQTPAATPAASADAGEPNTALAAGGAAHSGLFDLPMLVRDVYDSVALRAEEKSLRLSWFIAPNLSSLYEGDAGQLDMVLRALLKDAVEAAASGGIDLTVRRPPGGTDPGHLVFAVTDWNTRQTPSHRPMQAISQAWMLAQQSQGFFSVEHSPTGTTSVIFSVQLTALDEGMGALVLSAYENSVHENAHAHSALPVSAADTAELYALIETDSEQATPVPDPNAYLPSEEEAHYDLSLDTPFIGQPQEQAASPAAMPATANGEFDASVSKPLPGSDDRSGSDGALHPSAPSIIVANMTAGGRRTYLSQLAPLGLKLIEAHDANEATGLYARHPAGLVLFDADMPEVDIVTAVAAIRRLENEHDLPRAMLLAITAHDLQANRMAAAGMTESLIKPVTAELLQETVTRLMRQMQPEQTPEPAPAAIEPPAAPPHSAQAVADNRGESYEPAHEPPPLSMPKAVLTSVQGALLIHPPAAVHSIATPLAHEPGATETPASYSEDTAETKEGASTVAQPAPTQPAPVTPEQHISAGLQFHAESAPASMAAEAQAPRPASLPQPQPQPMSHAAPVAQSQKHTQDDEKTGQPTQESAPHPRELPLLDLIITDVAPEEEQQTETPPIAAPAPAAAPEAPARPHARHVSKQPVPRSVAISGAESALHSDLLSTENTVPTAAPPAHANGQAREAAPAAKVPLPGESDSISANLIPLIPGLQYTFSDTIQDARAGLEAKNAMAVQEAAARLAGKAEAFELTVLERMARCVERAAAADDMEAISDLLAELENVTARYKKALQQCHMDYSRRPH